MPTIIFRLKSGFELPVTCETYLFKSNFGTLEEYTLKGVTKNKPLFLPCDDIECVWEVEADERKTCPMCPDCPDNCPLEE